jgi:kumamolisin
MQAASQGISMCTSAGDDGVYDAAREFGLNYGITDAASLSVDSPADSPFITAADGSSFLSTSILVRIIRMLTTTRREWSWDYLYNYFDARGLNNPDDRSGRYLAGGGGSGFSQLFETQDYQLGVSGVKRYTGVDQWTPNACASIVAGIGKGGKMPNLSMYTDPYTGYKVWFSDPGAPGSNSVCNIRGNLLYFTTVMLLICLN